MCYKTSKFSREVGKNKQNEDSGKSRHKSNNKSRRENYSSEDSDSNKRFSISIIKSQVNANLFNFRKTSSVQIPIVLLVVFRKSESRQGRNTILCRQRKGIAILMQ